MSEDNSRFLEIPEINPKTQERPKLFLCRECGAAVGNRRVHLVWHKKLDEAIDTATRGYPEWPPPF